MPRKAHLEKHHSPSELKKKYLNSKDFVESRRWHLLWKVSLVKKLEEKHRESEVDLWFFDEHRIGLKPILRKVWAKVGERPMAVVQHRYEWLYVYGFVKPKTGETLWYLIPRVNTKWLNLVYQKFAVDAGISEKKSFVSRR
ncbi:MAG: hypothetical protein QNJ70_03995 [Xenococcaceae cyanobacterium MO_207.B15]|nr:hypothetical protein [Xenococcaceae cyanobacterium MO_207.B15]MDJ0746307.1 hypothetical protein [Xenococcaceae cyanobacterium MO_167.B27]